MYLYFHKFFPLNHQCMKNWEVEVERSKIKRMMGRVSDRTLSMGSKDSYLSRDLGHQSPLGKLLPSKCSSMLHICLKIHPIVF